MKAGLPEDTVKSLLATLESKERALTTEGKRERALGVGDARRVLHKAWLRQLESRKQRNTHQ